MATGFVLWFTGLSGAGKSTLTAMVGAELTRRGLHVEALDGDEVRKNLSKGLGFSKEDRDENVRRLGFVARLAARSGACAISAAISPYRAVREEIRAQTPRFCEVYCKCPIVVLSERDPKGLYKRAMRGEIKHFTGIDDPYEEPEQPDVLLNTDRESPGESARKVVARLEELGFIPRATWSPPQERHGADLIRPHGVELQPRLVHGEEAALLQGRVREASALVLDDAGRRALHDLATGCLSPLRGFMGPKDYLRVLADRRLESGLFWPTPLLLPLASADEARVTRAEELRLTDDAGRLLGVLTVGEIWQHPSAGATKLLSGDVAVFPDALLSPQHASAQATRAQLQACDFGSCVAGAVEGLPSRGDEYLLRAALETTQAVALQPIGAGALAAAAANSLLLGRYFPAQRALLLPILASAGGGSLEAWMLRAIAAQNCGCTELLVPDAALPGLLEQSHAGELDIRLRAVAPAAFSPLLGALVTERTAPDARPPAPSEVYRDDVLAARNVGGVRA